MTTKIFVIEPTRHDISPAAIYGTLVYLFAPDMHRSSIWSNAFRDEIFERLDALEFNPDVDYILAAGNQIPLLVLVGGIVARYNHCNILAFNASARQYIPLTVGKNTTHA